LQGQSSCSCVRCYQPWLIPLTPLVVRRHQITESRKAINRSCYRQQNWPWQPCSCKRRGRQRLRTLNRLWILRNISPAKQRRPGALHCSSSHVPG
jgi:hypothetical protein